MPHSVREIHATSHRTDPIQGFLAKNGPIRLRKGVLPTDLDLMIRRVQPLSPLQMFWIVVSGASLCVVGSLLVLSRACRAGEVELAYLGLFFLAVSVLPFVHGLTTPGVLYGDDDTVAT
jgi:hypothetical protein